MKKDRKEKRNVPNLRFEGFAGSWKEVKLDEIVTFKNGKAHEQNIVENGNYIVVNSKFISTNGKVKKYSNDLICSLNKNDIVMVMSDVPNGKALAKCYYIEDNNKYTLNQRICSLTSKYFNSKFLYYIINRNKYYLKFDSGVTQTNLRKQEVLNCPLIIPKTLEEQTKIANFFTKIDNRISTQRELTQHLKSLITGYRQKLFSQEFRFKDENGGDFPEWEERKLSDVLYEHKSKSTGNEEVHSVSVHKGIVNQIEHLGRSFSAKDTSHYSRALPNDIVYTKSPTGDFPLGIIKQNHTDKDVILSPLYGVFTPETKELGYILHVYFKSPINTSNYLSSIIQKGAKNTINITNKTFLSKKILLPLSKKEQTKIANFLSALDNKLKKEQEILEQYLQQKKYFLQNMFV